jgi:quercetin dioxygenase-like cupin family protein
MLRSGEMLKSGSTLAYLTADHHPYMAGDHGGNVNPMRLFVLVFLTFLGFIPQDAVMVNPKMVTVEFENDRVRILRVHFAPYERLDMHSHPALIVVAVTPNSRRAFQPDGSHQDLTGKAGDVAWREPLSHAVENLGKEPIENIEIEFKKATSPGVLVPRTDSSRIPSAQPDVVPVDREGHHAVLFENQYARVLDVRIPPGETTQFHTHTHDNISIRISGGQIQTQFQSKEWQPSAVKPGAVVFSEGSKNPYTHRIENLGASVYQVVDVELLP